MQTVLLYNFSHKISLTRGRELVVRGINDLDQEVLDVQNEAVVFGNDLLFFNGTSVDRYVREVNIRVPRTIQLCVNNCSDVMVDVPTSSLHISNGCFPIKLRVLEAVAGQATIICSADIDAKLLTAKILAVSPGGDRATLHVESGHLDQFLFLSGPRCHVAVDVLANIETGTIKALGKGSILVGKMTDVEVETGPDIDFRAQ
ncbi:MAG: hypothetical protein KKA90_03380 [Nanoarchaeota archaeon]|nr:hypothetical protein [Nanoarchaeota archaeon]